MQKIQNSKIFQKYIFTFEYVLKHCPINFFKPDLPISIIHIAPTLGIKSKRKKKNLLSHHVFFLLSASGMDFYKLCSGTITCYGLNYAPSEFMG